MRITIESTTKIVELNGVPARVWEGHTESGVAVHCMVTRIACDVDADRAQFDAELTTQRAPSPAIARAYDHRMIL